MERLTKKDEVNKLYYSNEVFYENDHPRSVYGGKVVNKLGQLEDIEQELGIELIQLRRKRKYLIIDVENFIKNCKKLVYKTTDNELVISLNAKLVLDDKIEKDIEDYLKESVIKTLLGEIENKSFAKEELEK